MREAALLAFPERTRTEKDAGERERAQAEMERAAALTVVRHAIRSGDSREQAVEDLRALGLIPDPLSVERHHFGKPRGAEAG
jgi:hypothetical protein